MDVEKLNRLEEEAQELLTIHALTIQATYTKDGKNSSEVQRRKGTMVKSFNERKLDQRYGKINLHTSRNLPVHGDLENMLVLSKQYDLTLEVRAPWSSWLPEGPSKQKFYMMVNT